MHPLLVYVRSAVYSILRITDYATCDTKSCGEACGWVNHMHDVEDEKHRFLARTSQSARYDNSRIGKARPLSAPIFWKAHIQTRYDASLCVDRVFYRYRPDAEL